MSTSGNYSWEKLSVSNRSPLDFKNGSSIDLIILISIEISLMASDYTLCLITCAGFPATIAYSGTSLDTTAPAPTIEPLPI